VTGVTQACPAKQANVSFCAAGDPLHIGPRGVTAEAHATDRERVHVDGQPILLPPDLATPFGLLLHELATNAAKHGGFVQPYRQGHGHVDRRRAEQPSHREV